MMCHIRRPAMLALRLPKHIKESLENLAKKKGRTPAYYARKAIVAMIEDMADSKAIEERLAENNPRVVLADVLAEFADDMNAAPCNALDH